MDPRLDYQLRLTRRQFFGRAGGGIGAAALATLLSEDLGAAEGLPGLPHFAPTAKRVIYLFQSGAPSQMDMFDYKPRLNDLRGSELPASIRMGQRLTGMTSTQATFPVAPPMFKFAQHGQSGAWVSELLPHTAKVVDDLCFIKSMHTEAINHDPGITFFQTGAQLAGRPSIGSWISYGLGSENNDLPSFVVMVSQGTGRSGDQPLYDRLWGSGFLPSKYQGVKFRSTGDPVLYLSNPSGFNSDSRRKYLDYLARLNQMKLEESADPEIATRIAQYEMAFRMQSSVPDLTDLSKEPERIFELYGPESRKPGTFAANCLLARRLAERGVRFIQLFHRGWDHHNGLPKAIVGQCHDTDQASAALVQDLKERNLLQDTLVVWGGEFGRTVYCQGKLTADDYGRDHHPRCFTVWLAGGGVKPGITYGETDDYCYNIARDPVHVHDLHATILRCLGVDHTQLTFKYQGRHFRLTDVQGVVKKEILADALVLTWLDYAVLAGYLIAITLFGSYFARFQKTTRDYFLTGRSVPWWAICFTIVATETSTLTFISVPATAYAGDMTFLQLVFGYVIGRVIVSVIFIPAYFRGDLFTSYELLQRRFGDRVKNVAAVIFLITRSLADGIRLFATALVISVVTQVPVTAAVFLIGGAMIVYTVRGGSAAVIWTDVVQLFVYVAGAAVVFVSLLSLIPGGWAEVVHAGAGAGKFRVFDLSWNLALPYTLWSGIIGGVALTLATHGTDQFLVQRLLSARSAREAALGLVLSGFLVLAQFVLFLLIGVMLFTYYQHVPLPRALARSDELLPGFIVTALSHGVAGFIVAAIVAAALSPSINSMAATTVNDFYAKYVRPDADEATLMRVSRAWTIVWGAAQIGVAIAAQRMQRSVLDAGLAVLSWASGPVLGAFLLATLAPAITEGQAFGGMIAGLLAMTIVWGWPLPIAFTWYVFIGAATTVTSRGSRTSFSESLDGLVHGFDLGADSPVRWVHVQRRVRKGRRETRRVFLFK